MEFIPMNILEYRLNENGTTEKIIVAFQTYQGNEQFNARVSLTDEYVKGINENLDLDIMNREQVENFAKRKLRDWIMIDRPAEEEIPVEEQPTE